MINPQWKRWFQLTLLAIAIASTSAQVAAQPNIVIIMADDLGYGDVGCYGATKIRTPNIDRLAGQGMKFGDAHTAASVCSPSRYGLMTGRSPWRLGKKGNGYRLEQGRMTLATLVKKKGYRTAAIGKWHLGYGSNWVRPLRPGPLEAGFDYHFGVPTNHNDKYRAYVENDDFFGLEPGEILRVVKGQKFPSGLAKPRVDDQVDTTLTKKAIEFIRANSNSAFFLYFTPCATHTHITPAGKYRGTSQAGLLGDYVQELDAHVGEILTTLDQLGLAKKTLVIFTSDNGSTPKDFKGTQNVDLNLAAESGDVRRRFKTAKADAKRLGHITNGPWRDGKGKPFEGGHRVPFIARWPDRIAADTHSDHPLCLTDMMATLAELLRVDLADDAGEDSFSVLSTLLGKSPKNPSRSYNFIQGDTKNNAIAVRLGRWKLIDSALRGKVVHRLYDLSVDPRESKNVATRHPATVAKLAAALAKARTAGRTRPRAANPKAFLHPGIAHNQEAFAFVRTKLKEKRQPWTGAWEVMVGSKYARLDRAPRPRPHVERGAYNKPNVGASDFMHSGTASYTHALIWALSGEERHARKAAEILDAWSRSLKTVTNHDARLLIGMSGHQYCNAAEILKHTWNGWPAKAQDQFAAMLRDVWYPVIKDFYPTANGNWDASMLQTMIAMGVFLDDHTMYQRAVNYFQRGTGNGALGNYFNEFGQCQESGRDQAHTQMGLEYLANTCETGYIQGLDLYGHLNNRLLLGFEYTAKFNLGHDVRFEPFKSFEGRYHYKRLSNKSRGNIRPTYEKVLHHYHHRLGLDAPFTKGAVEKSRIETGGASSLPWGTLMHARPNDG